MTFDLEEVAASHGPDEPARFIAIADYFLTADDPHAAAAALDRAYGLAPEDADLARHRASILDQLAVREHGMVWRYVPAGTFAMGSEHGDPDERPVHQRRLDAFWITDVPITWHDFCALLGWHLPPAGWPPDLAELEHFEWFGRFERYEQLLIVVRQKIRNEYEDLAEESSHAGAGAEPAPPRRYDRKPMIAASIREAETLCARLSTAAIRCALPTEAQWEKAARGGLAGRRYAWGDAPPTRACCDFDRMGDYRVIDPRELPPNGYGLYGMCGGVSEWTADVYDALAYHRARAGDLARPTVPEDTALGVLRGGSWTDCAGAVTVSHRSARHPARTISPTIGFRLVRAPA